MLILYKRNSQKPYTPQRLLLASCITTEIMPGTWAERLKEEEVRSAQFEELRRKMREDADARVEASELRRLAAIEKAEKAEGRSVLLYFS